MPNTPQEKRTKADVARHGGAKKVRTISKGDSYRHLYVTRDNDHIVVGPKQKKKKA